MSNGQPGTSPDSSDLSDKDKWLHEVLGVPMARLKDPSGGGGGPVQGSTNTIEPLGQASKDALGAAPGNAASAKAKAGGKSVPIEMEPEEIIVPVSQGGTPGDTGEQQIDKLIQGMRDDVQDYWDNYTRGLASFETSMAFSSEEEAEPAHLQAALKTVAKKAFDLAIDEAGKKLGGPWGTVISVVKGVAEGWAAESERVAAAAGQVRIRDYITEIRNGISAQQNKMTTALEKGKQPMFAEYHRLAADDLSKGKASEAGVLVGEAAGLVNGLRDGALAFRANIPSEGKFQQLFSRNFADTPGRSDYVSHGGVPTGKLYFGVSVYVDPTKNEKNPLWKIKSKDDTWKLVTKAPKPDRVADSLKMSLGGKKPWEIELEKMVQISVEVEESFSNSYQEGWIVFTSSPDQYQVRSNYGPKWFDLAWKNPAVRSTALDNVNLKGGSDY